MTCHRALLELNIDRSSDSLGERINALHGFEVASICNLFQQDTDLSEAIALLPSLQTDRIGGMSISDNQVNRILGIVSENRKRLPNAFKEEEEEVVVAGSAMEEHKTAHENDW